MTVNSTKPSVLFVCYANICRSPTAEAVFRKKVRDAGLDVHIDSAGTNCLKPGNRPDKRSQKAAIARGYDFAGINSRPIISRDFESFDYILPMDASNLRSLQEKSAPDAHGRMHLFMNFAAEHIRQKVSEVPDPYHGGQRGFEIVLDLIEYAADGLVEHLRAN